METAENWYALSLSIVGNLTPEQAIRWMEDGHMSQSSWKKLRVSVRNLSQEKPKRLRGIPASKEEVEENKRKRREEARQMAEMRKSGMTYVQIGEKFNLCKSHVRTLVIKYEKENP